MPAINTVARINGQFATISLATTGFTGAESGATAVPALAVFALFDWEVNIETETTDATAHGDYWKQPIILTNSWRGRAKAYITALQQTSYASFWRLQNGSAAGAYKDPPLINFVGYNDWTSLGSGKILWEGIAYCTRGNLSVPMAMAEQELEFEGVGSPTTIG